MSFLRPLRLAAILPAALLAGLLQAATPAWAADAPNAEQRTRIEAALRQLGFVSWGEIERENNGTVWEVDDARLPDGSKYDVKLAADDLREIERKRD